MKLSEWQDGVPPCDGVWQIYVSEHVTLSFNGVYYARFKDGKWGAGSCYAALLKKWPFSPYPSNNNPDKPRQWRGEIDE